MTESTHIPGTARSPIVCLANRARYRWFDSPSRIVTAYSLDQVPSAIEAVERETEAGRVAAGFVAYEAAPAFDSALRTHAPGEFPLVWFAVFDADVTAVPRPPRVPRLPDLNWTPETDERAYRESLARIRKWIAAGDTYQVNYTYPTRAAFTGDPWLLFEAMNAAQPTDFGMYADLGRFVVASVSPEQFFDLDGDRIVTRPMKGTAPRGLWFADDERCAAAMRESAKERAENVMIVDMLRNDLGRIARTGSVNVASLFDVERHPTVWQMTSTIEARTDASLLEIFRALFPSASVTGAPKVRTMEIIRELELSPRGVYCGALGWVGPGRRARFSVGIRTATIDRESRAATYHVGSGITWDSVAAAEHNECRLKATVLRHRRPDFDLLESLLWDGEYFLLDDHLARLRDSAAYFGYAFDAVRVRAALQDAAAGLSVPMKVRLLLDSAGRAAADAVAPVELRPVLVDLAVEPVDSSNVYLYHKTTHRAVYEGARTLGPECGDVILWNEHGEITESTVANVVVRFGDTWYTPPIACGLLPGVMRAMLLRDGRIREARVSLADFDRADEIALVNSVRRWIPAMRVRSVEPQTAVTA